jgi:hypothetical protein
LKLVLVVSIPMSLPVAVWSALVISAWPVVPKYPAKQISHAKI